MEKFFSRLAKTNFFLNLIVLGRPWNGLLIGIMSLIGFFLIGTSENPFLIPLIFISFIIQYYAGAVINDLNDFKTDKINMPYRPLVIGTVNRTQAIIAATIAYTLSLIIGYLVSFHLFVGLITFLILTIVYSIKPMRFVSRGFLANLTLAAVTIFIPLSTGSAIALGSFNLPLQLIISYILLSLFFSFYIILKDFKDYEGDLKTRKKTFVVLFGPILSGKLMLIGSTSFYLLAIYLLMDFFTFSNLYIVLSLSFLIGHWGILHKFILSSISGNLSEKKFSQSRILLFIYFLLVLILLIYLN